MEVTKPVKIEFMINLNSKEDQEKALARCYQLNEQGYHTSLHDNPEIPDIRYVTAKLRK